MNYRHAFHAGNEGDVLKHAILVLLVQALAAKDKPFRVIDTHAGIGRYDLEGDEARRGGEATRGILKVLAAPDPPAEIAEYLELVRRFGLRDGRLRWYPGSPRLARAGLRDGDRLALAELHPADAASLAEEFKGDGRVLVEVRDGWQALRAWLPPPERRGLVLIDPPFERPGEFDRLADGLAGACRRFPTGVYALWYPLKDRAAVAAFHDRLRAAGPGRMLLAELAVRGPGPAPRFDGAGLVLVNPPWQLDDKLGRLLPWLSRTLAQDPGAAWRLDWVAPG